MLGLFGTLDLGTRALQTQRLGVEIAGHNIANVNNTAYARQRLDVSTSVTIQTGLGLQGTGAEGVAIVQLRNALLDTQIQNETSVSGYLEAQQFALQFAETSLGQTIERDSATTSDSTGQYGIADGLDSLFSAFQSLSNDPSSAAERQALVMKASDLAARFNVTTQRLDGLETQLDNTIRSDVNQANQLLADIASLNDQISKAEVATPNGANDLRDLRQSKLEALAKLTSFKAVENPDGTVDVTIAGANCVSGLNVLEKLEVYDAGDGRSMVRVQNAGTPLEMTGGSIAGSIDVRDGELKTLRSNLDLLATTLISEVNTIHQAGFNLSGGTGAAFFTGTGADDIQVNPDLLKNPALLQASAVNGTAGDNQVVLALAQLAQKPLAALNNCTLSENYAQTVAALGQSISSTNTRLSDQVSVQNMLTEQRDSLSGVSLDEEMTNIMKFQKAYEASARLISVVGEMFDTLLQIQR